MEKAFLEALECLFYVFLVVIMVMMARQLAAGSKCSRLKAYAWAVGVSAFIAVMAWGILETYPDDEATKYLGGGITAYYGMTDTEGRHLALVIFIVVAAAILFGTYAGFKDRDKRDEM